MKKITIFLGAVFLISLFFATDSFSQRGGGQGGGWGMNSKYGRIYNPKTVTTVRGEVLKVRRITPMRGMSYGIHLDLKTAKDTISVHLGPAWYINNQDTEIAEKDKIGVRGSRVTFNGKPAIIASEVTKGDQMLRLRDAQGFPYWSGWKRRRF